MANNLVKVPTLITTDYLAMYSPLPSNYDFSEVENYVHISEKIDIEPIIGTPLYEVLLDEVERDEVTPEHATLLLQIYPLLGFSTVYNALPFISYNISQIGITRGHSENSDSVDTKDVNYISNHLKSQVEVMKALLKKFLDEHKDYYPEYYPDDRIVQCDCSNDCEDYQWIYDYYNGGVFDKYAWQRAVTEHRMKKFGPRPYQQLYTTRRYNMNLR